MDLRVVTVRKSALEKLMERRLTVDLQIKNTYLSHYNP